MAKILSKTIKRNIKLLNLTKLNIGDDPQSSELQKSLKSKKKRLQNRIFIVKYLWNRQIRLLEGYEGVFIRPAAKTTRIRLHIDNLRSHVLPKTRHRPFK